MVSGNEGPGKTPSSPADLSGAPSAGTSHTNPENPDEAPGAFSRSRRRLSEFLAFLTYVLRDDDRSRRLGFLIGRLGMAGALIVVPVAALGYIMLGSVAGYFTAGLGAGSAVAITISVSGRLSRKKKRKGSEKGSGSAGRRDVAGYRRQGRARGNR